MKKLEIYDPALCCSSGVCGPSPDSRLAAFASAVGAFKGCVALNRYNLAQEPGAFASQPVVKQVLQEEGPQALPVILVDGKLAMKGVYPTSDQLAQLLGLENADACCGDAAECCSGDEQDCCANESSETGKSDCCGGSSCC